MRSIMGDYGSHSAVVDFDIKGQDVGVRVTQCPLVPTRGVVVYFVMTSLWAVVAIVISTVLLCGGGRGNAPRAKYD